MIFPWQTSAWDDWDQLRRRLPHAIIFKAGEGEGVFEFAQSAAQALLCENPQAKRQACGTCAACGWFRQGNHPDYRSVVPDSMAGEPPEEDGEPSKKEKRSAQIRIEQVRALADFLAVGTHRSGPRVVLIYPADSMNVNTQNALLKSLEEPPPATVFLLVTTLPNRLLPTVRSRCLTFVLPLPDSGQACAWLKAKEVPDPEAALARAGGAPLAVLLAQENEAEHVRFLKDLQDARFDPISVAEQIQRAPLPEVVAWLQRWSYDLLSFRVAGVVRYHPKDERVIGDISRNCEALNVAAYLRQLAEARGLAGHPLNAKLFLEDLLLGYQRLISRT